MHRTAVIELGIKCSGLLRSADTGSPMCHRLRRCRLRVTAIYGATPARASGKESSLFLPRFLHPRDRAPLLRRAAEGSGFCPRVQSVVHPRGPIQWALRIYAAARTNIKTNLFRARKRRRGWTGGGGEGKRGQYRSPPGPHRPHLFRAGHQNAIYAG